VVDAVKALGDIRIQDELGLVAYTVEQRLLGIMGGASWAEAIAVGLEVGLPLGFEGEFHHGLCCSVAQYGNAKWSLVVGSWFWNPDPARGLWLGRDAQERDEAETTSRGKTFHPVHACRLFASIILGHFAYSQTFG